MTGHMKILVKEKMFLVSTDQFSKWREIYWLKSTTAVNVVSVMKLFQNGESEKF